VAATLDTSPFFAMGGVTRPHPTTIDGVGLVRVLNGHAQKIASFGESSVPLGEIKETEPAVKILFQQPDRKTLIPGPVVDRA
jgi:hypothetical protein